jgi:uncharacterized protein
MNRHLVLLAALAFLSIAAATIIIPWHAGPPRVAEVCWRPGDCARLDVLDDPQSMKKGLMGVSQMPEDGGVLLVFERPGINGEWMRGMLISTDFIWMDEDNTVVQVLSSLPPCGPGACEVHTSPVPVLYGAEVNAGYAARHNLSAGMKVEITYENKV